MVLHDPEEVRVIIGDHDQGSGRAIHVVETSDDWFPTPDASLEQETVARLCPLAARSGVDRFAGTLDKDEAASAVDSRSH
jgi:hypothetical protein